MADGSTPSPDLIPAPVAEGVEDVLSCVAEHVSHQFVTGSGARTLADGACLDVGLVAVVAWRVTVVVLPVVDTPAGKQVGILLLMTLTSGKSGTSLDTSVTVETKLQAHFMDLIDDGLDTSWPLAGVGYKVAL